MGLLDNAYLRVLSYLNSKLVLEQGEILRQVDGLRKEFQLHHEQDKVLVDHVICSRHDKNGTIRFTFGEVCDGVFHPKFSGACTVDGMEDMLRAQADLLHMKLITDYDD